MEVLSHLFYKDVRHLCLSSKQFQVVCSHRLRLISHQVNHLLSEYQTKLYPSRFVSFNEIKSILDQYTTYHKNKNNIDVQYIPKGLGRIIIYDDGEGKFLSVSVDDQFLITPGLSPSVMKQLLFHLLYDRVVDYHD